MIDNLVDYRIYMKSLGANQLIKKLEQLKTTKATSNIN